MTKQVHSGHRDRLKNRFREEGLTSFTDIQVLEMLLFYSIPQKDTNELAHALLDRFVTLDRVLEAPAYELEKIPGIKQNTSTFLNFVAQLACRYEVRRVENKHEVLDSIRKCGEYLCPRFIGCREEKVYLLCLDAKCKVLDCTEVGEGSINATAISVRKVVEKAMGSSAVSGGLAHNHPSGVAVPSEEDIATTRRIARALDAVGVYLVDHIVVADEDYVSLLDSGLYRPDECRAW